jgi:transposase-like protein
MGRKSNYSESYKREAVAKAEASGNVSQTARELGISTKSLHDWIKQFGQPLDIDNASVQELSARVRQLERQLALREGQIEVLKKAIGIVSAAEQNGTR